MRATRWSLAGILCCILSVFSSYCFAQTLIDTIQVGGRPAPGAINVSTNKIYVPDVYGNTVAVIDGISDQVITVQVGAAPAAAAVNSSTNKIYVANNADGTVTIINGTTLTTTTVTVDDGPESVAVNPATNKIYVVNCGPISSCSSGTVTVIDGNTNNTTSIPVEQSPNGIAINTIKNKIYVVNNCGNSGLCASGTVSVIDGASNTVTATINVGREPGRIAVDEQTNKIYVTNSLDGNVTVIDGNTDSTTTIRTGNGPSGVAVDPVTDMIYVTNEDSQSVTAINGSNNSTTTIAVGTGPDVLTVDSTNNKITVGNSTAGTVTIIDGLTNNTSTVTVGSIPGPVADPATGRIYVSNSNSGTVSVIGLNNGSYSLTVSLSPTGGGSVTSTDNFINCPGTCSHSYSNGTHVTLNATPGQGWSFGQWSGGCSGSGSCQLEMSGTQAVTANFTQSGGSSELSVSISGNGVLISSDGYISCPGICSHSYSGSSSGSSQVTLYPVPAQGWFFGNWGGACSGSGSCTVEMSQNVSVSASFSQATPVQIVYNYTPVSGVPNAGTLAVTFDVRTDSFLATDCVPHTGGCKLSGEWNIGLQPVGTCNNDNRIYPNAAALLDSYGLLWIAIGGGEYRLYYDSASGQYKQDYYVSGCSNPQTSIISSGNIGGWGGPYPLTITPPISGSGTITSTDGMISCPGSCTYNYPGYSLVTLVATPAAGWTFIGWNGVCVGVGPCVVTVSQSFFVTATFTETGPLQFVPLSPCRLADTRITQQPIPANSFEAFPVPQLGCNVPADAWAYSLNVTMIPEQGGAVGFLSIYPTGATPPTSSLMNSWDGRYKADATIVPAGANGWVSVYSSNKTDVVLDINGYFLPPSGSTLYFHPLSPCRVADTRWADGSLGGPNLQAAQQRDLPVLQSQCGIPGSAKAYSFNFTIVPRGGPVWVFSAWPADEPQPKSSTLNAPTATVVANGAIVPAASDGDIDVWASNDTDLALDVNGYFDNIAEGGLSLYNVPPCRVLDTRTVGNGSPFTGQLTPAIDVLNTACGVAGSAQAYVFNATIVPAGVPVWLLTLWPDGGTLPNASTLNAWDAAVTSNMAIVPTNNGSIDAYTVGLTQLIMDLYGYFAP